MRNLKNYKKILVTMLMFASLQTLWSLPGIKQYIPDNSGEYVYYRDYSFKNDTIVGFLYYNEETYAARIYSPASEKQHLLETDITIYFTVNTSKTKFEMTGEKIDGTVQGNSDYVNYLHDLLYEFSARRSLIEMDSGEPSTVNDDMLQFGGDIAVRYNPFVPLFNIEEIKLKDGKPVFQIETAGCLADSNDSSFADFKGGLGLPKDKVRNFKNKSSAASKAVFKNQSVMIDGQWKQSMENLWLLDDFAILSMNEIAVADDLPEQSVLDFFARRFSLGTTHSYAMYRQGKIKFEAGGLSVMNVFFQPDSGNVTRDFKIIKRKSDGVYSLMTITVFDSVYQKNRKYFDGILKSYKTE